MTTPQYDEIVLEFDREAGVAVLTLDRPEVHNALNASIRSELTDAIRRTNEEAAIGALVLTGAGERAFSVGADIKSPGSNHSTEEFGTYLEGKERNGGWYRMLCHYPKAIISATNGYVAGSGLQLALTGDVLLATPSSKFWIPQVSLGLAPHVGSMIKLARMIGQQRMLEMVLTGRRIEADEAHRIGLVSDVVNSGDLLDRAKELASRIAAQPRLAVRMTKESYFQGIDLAWDQAMRVDQWKEFGMWQTQDRRDRHAEFLNR